jgi:hypothetical protein
LAFAVPGTNTRFALHVENKIDAPFAPYQAEDYSLRAAHMRNNRWVPYSDWTTLLIAPRRYVNRNASSSGQFDTVLTYEEVASHVPEFASYCSRQV